MNIWEERKIFSPEVIRDLRSKVVPGKSTSSEPKKSAPSAPPVYEAPVPFVKSLQALKALEKKRYVQGGQMATDIDASVTDPAVLEAAKGDDYKRKLISIDPAQVQELMKKIADAIKLTGEYRSTMQEEYRQRENLLTDLRKELAEQESQQSVLNSLRMVRLFKRDALTLKNIETIENEFLASRRKLDSLSK